MLEISELLIIKLFLSGISCHVTLYLAKEESMRVFGATHAVYYVREGVRNKFAQNTLHGFLLPDSVEYIDFSWVSDTQHCPYRIDINHTGEVAASLASHLFYISEIPNFLFLTINGPGVGNL